MSANNGVREGAGALLRNCRCAIVRGTRARRPFANRTPPFAGPNWIPKSTKRQVLALREPRVPFVLTRAAAGQRLRSRPFAEGCALPSYLMGRWNIDGDP